MNKLIRKYKIALLFLLKFVVLYVLLNLIYAFYIEYYHPEPDPVTSWVTQQTSAVLNVFAYNTVAVDSPTQPHVFIFNTNDVSVLRVYEGCNGLNVIIIFLAFILSFKWQKKNSWFMPLGIFIIHIANIGRVTMLYFVSEYFENYMYFAHKYLFTASIFAIIFALWYIWLKKIYHASA